MVSRHLEAWGAEVPRVPPRGSKKTPKGWGVPLWRLGTLRDLGRAEGLVFLSGVIFSLRDL